MSPRERRDGPKAVPLLAMWLRRPVDRGRERRVDRRRRVGRAAQERAGRVLAVRRGDADAVRRAAGERVPVNALVSLVEVHDLGVLSAVEVGRRDTRAAHADVLLLDLQLERLPTAGRRVVRQQHGDVERLTARKRVEVHLEEIGGNRRAPAAGPADGEGGASGHDAGQSAALRRSRAGRERRRSALTAVRAADRGEAGGPDGAHDDADRAEGEPGDEPTPAASCAPPGVGSAFHYLFLPFAAASMRPTHRYRPEYRYFRGFH